MMDDDALITAIASGDDTALRDLFSQHAPWIGARLRRVLPAEAVEDVLQETFIAVWRGAGRYQVEGALGAWVWGIARRQAALWARRRGRPEPALDVAGATAGGEDPADVAVRNADLERALALLGPDGHEGRELVRLFYVEDRPVAEVAGLLGIPPGTVKSRLHKVRGQLRAALLGGGVD